MAKNETDSIRGLVLAGLLLALAQILPFFTAQIPQIDLMLLPMYIPVFLCGYLCGESNGLMIGVIAPIMRSVLFGAPPIGPYATAMSFELAIYGFLAGILHRLLPPKWLSIYIVIAVAMFAGRLCWGTLFVFLVNPGLNFTTWAVVMTGVFPFAIISIVIQMVLIPLVIVALKRAKIIL